MPVASGSIAFLGAARFQGYWDASTNTGTGSIYGGISGEKLGLFETGSSPGAGYQVETGLTASKGDYWQVTGSGTHNVDSETSWQLNDFCIFSGSVSGQGSWKRLAFEDTVASIILGDLDSSSFHMGTGSDTQVIFGHGAVFSGSGDLSYKYLESKLAVAGIVSASAAQFDNITLGPSGLAGPAATVSSSAGTFAVLSGSAASLHRVLANSVTAVSQVTAATVSASSGQFATLSGSTITPHLITLGPGGLAGSAATVSASAGTFAVLSGSTVNVHALTSAGTLSAPTLSGSSGQFATLSGSTVTAHVIHGDGSKLQNVTGTISAIANGVNNRVATFGSADSLNGEIALQFDGSTLTLAGVMTGSSYAGFSATGNEAIYTTVSGNALSGHGLSVGNGDVRVNGGDIIVNNAGGGDAKIAFKIGDVHKWTAGIDASDNSLQDPKFKIRYSTAAADLAVGAHLELDSSGSLVLSGSLTATSGTVSASAGTYAILSGSAATINNLTLGNTAVTSDAGELNLLDGASAGSLASSKAVIYSAADIVTASAHVGFRSAATEGVFTSVTGSQITSFAGNFTVLGNTLARHFTASLGMLVPDGRFVHFGTEQESHIRYDETGQDMLTISGSHAGGIVLSGSKLMLDINGSPDIVASGSRGGPGSYLALAANGQVVLSTPAGGGTISSVANGADNRIATFSDSDALNGEANLTFNGSALTLAGTMTGSSYSGFNITATEGVFTTITGSSFAGFRSTATEVVGTTVSASSAGFAVLSGSALSAHTLAVSTFAPATVSASSGEFATLSGSAVTVDSLSLGNTAITSDAGEINLLDGSSAGALASSKAVIYSAADIVTGSAFIGFRAAATEGAFGSTNGGVITGSSFTGFSTAATQVIGAAGTFVALSGSAATLHNITLNNVAVSADAGEINLLDGAAAGTLASSKAVVYSSADVVTGSAFVGFRATVSELGNTTANQLTASQGAKVLDNLPLHFGTDQDSHIRYDEAGQDFLTISGSSAGTVLSGSIVAVAGTLQLSDASTLPASNGGLAAVGGTLVVSGSNIADGTVAVADDEVVFLDADGSLKRETIADFTSAIAGTGLTAASGQLVLHFAEIGGVTMASTDSVMILDNGSATKRVSVTNLAAYQVGTNGGLAQTSGVMSISGSAIADGTVAVADDQIIFLDSDGSVKRETIADLASGMAGTGLDASSGQLTVDFSGPLEVEQSSTGGGSALLIDNDDVDQIALEIEPANTTANVFEMTGSALTTGGAIKVYSNSSDNSARSLVKIANDNTSATKAVGLTINQMGAAPAAVVRGSNIYNVLTHTGANAFVTGQTISASFIAGGQYNVAGRNSGQSDTTDTAANILAAMGDVAISDFAEFFYLNMSSNSVTIAGGTNVLMANMGTASFAIAAGKGRRFAVVVLSNHPASPKVQFVPTSDSFNLTS